MENYGEEKMIAGRISLLQPKKTKSMKELLRSDGE